MKSLRLILIAMTCAMMLMACKSTGAKTDSMAQAAPVLKSARLTVPGADCASTGAAAELLIGRIEGVKSAMVDIDATTADITYDASVISLDDIKTRLEDTEYPVSKMEELE